MDQMNEPVGSFRRKTIRRPSFSHGSASSYRTSEPTRNDCA
ncbi:hypothetical protein AKJ09_03004 [Labilithrix luteola]|uniref:Uncharacterized protein n=1 Tax=Labilithrix luteola TaxID=1391654 RepID=A0A0K1PS30_9BACT|nr:hypothetical protein AKJ09_03004 [Labilithrix luteola]